MGNEWRQRLRLMPLYLAMAAADRLAAIVPARVRRELSPWRPGVTVIIPERDAPEMLARALASLDIALAAIDEPRQVIVVANGAPRAAYGPVAARFPAVEWVYVDAPLGFAGAIERGLQRARYDGTYLMNNDMTLDPRAIAELCRRARPTCSRSHRKLPARRAVRPPRGNGIHRLVRRPLGRAFLSRAAALIAGAAGAPLRKRRRRAVPHGAAHPVRA